MGIHIQPSRFPKGEVADVQNYPVASGEVFLLGAAIQVVAGEATEAASPVAAAELAGFALNGTIAAGQSSSPAGVIGVAKAKNQQIYAGQAVTGAANPILQDISGIAIGDGVDAVKSTDAASLNEWVFDTGLTGMIVVDKDDDLALLFVQVLDVLIDPNV